MNDDEGDDHDDRVNDGADDGGDGGGDGDAWLRGASAAAPLDQLRAARIGARARAVFVANAASRRRPPAWRIWSAVVAPGLLISAVGYYITWAVSFAAALYR